MRQVLCVWLPNWPIQRRLAALRTVERGLPQALALYTTQRRGAVIVARCAAAAAYGIRPGLSLAEARSLAEPVASAGTGQPRASTDPALVERQPNFDGALVRFDPHDPQADRQSLEQLAEWCQQFTPLVGCEEAEQPECLLLDVTGTLERWGGAAALCRQVTQAFVARGWQTQVALGETIGAAWAWAHAAAVEAPSSAAALPVQVLRLSPDQCRILAELGIESVGQLARLPRGAVAARLGPEILARVDQALGRRSEVIAGWQPGMPAEVIWHFEVPTAHHDVLAAVLQRLLEELCARLVERRQGVIELTCHFQPESGRVWSLPVALFQPCDSPRRLWELLELQLEQRRLRGLISAVRIELLRAQAVAYRQRQMLWDEQGVIQTRDPAGEARQWSALLEQLSSRLGREAVLQVQPQADPQPEQAYRLLPWLVHAAHGPSAAPRRRVRRPRATEASAQPPRLAPVAAENTNAAAVDPALGLRPLRLFARPRPVKVRCLQPDGPPWAVRRAARECRVLQAWGPERIETGWWRRRLVARDYYRLEMEDGAWLWVFRRLPDGAWFWQGTFD